MTVTVEIRWNLVFELNLSSSLMVLELDAIYNEGHMHCKLVHQLYIDAKVKYYLLNNLSMLNLFVEWMTKSTNFFNDNQEMNQGQI